MGSNAGILWLCGSCFDGGEELTIGPLGMLDQDEHRCDECGAVLPRVERIEYAGGWHVGGYVRAHPVRGTRG